jgi:catechol 2,3-dioxygenase-like lactoylglutathione lyase family enzyme
MTDNFTKGIDHVGLTVKDLDASRAFFVDCLGWKVIGGKPDYPSVFVSDGFGVLTLWRVGDPSTCIGFNRRTNIGLHHLALKVADRQVLDEVHAKVSTWPGVVVEFPPQLSGSGPKFHMMIEEPGGNRIEFAWDPR